MIYSERGNRDSTTEISITAFSNVCKIANNHQGSTGSKLVRVPPVMPQRIGLWFAILEGQFASAGITDDDAKLTALIDCLETRYLEQIENTVLNPSVTGRYDKLKNELILLRPKETRQSFRVRRFHPHALEESPTSTHVLAAVDDISADKLTRAADQIEEAYSENGQRASRLAAVIEPPVQNMAVIEPWIA